MMALYSAHTPVDFDSTPGTLDSSPHWSLSLLLCVTWRVRPGLGRIKGGGTGPRINVTTPSHPGPPSPTWHLRPRRTGLPPLLPPSHIFSQSETPLPLFLVSSLSPSLLRSSHPHSPCHPPLWPIPLNSLGHFETNKEQESWQWGYLLPEWKQPKPSSG